MRSFPVALAPRFVPEAATSHGEFPALSDCLQIPCARRSASTSARSFGADSGKFFSHAFSKLFPWQDDLG